jgi:hypothetical protein
LVFGFFFKFSLIIYFSMEGGYLLEILSVSLGIDSGGEIEYKGIIGSVVCYLLPSFLVFFPLTKGLHFERFLMELQWNTGHTKKE